RKVLRGETVYLPPVQVKESNDYFQTYLIPIKDEAAEVSAILWIVHDLSNEWELQQVQRQAQQTLEAEHRRLKEAQAIGRVGSFTWEVGSAFSYWSDELYRINGLEPQSEEMTLDKVDQFTHPGDFAELQKLKETSLATPGQYKIVHRIVLRSGEVRWVSHQWESIANETGTVVRVTGVVQDITERKTAETELMQRQQLLQATMDSSRDMIQVFKAVRDEKGEIVDFRYVLLNHEAEKWMPAAVGKSLLELQPGVVEEGIFAAFKQVVETGEPQQYEKHYVHEQFNGWFYQSVVKLDDGVATTTADITVRKKAEEELLRLKDEIAQQAEDRYRVLFNAMDEGVSTVEVIFDENEKV
ncbi:MAG TPA: PAS domain-containing protein, partial [Flavisolibacter sp.]|nr:PAS domain-containing protein [Flavisolibacter sp.]